jgi:hypothetical protein
VAVDKIIDRIQKLLALAANAGSEQEAALAAERAAQLMAQHEIHEAQLTADGANVRTPEPIERRHYITHTAKRVQWHMNIAAAVDETYGAQAYWHGGSVVLFGRLSAVQAAAYTTQYLIREIERITDRMAPSSYYGRAYRNAFRLGCSSRVGARIRAEHAKAEAARREAAARGAAREHDGGEQTSHVAEAASPPAPGSIEEQLWQGDAGPEPGDEPERGDDHDDEQTEEEAEEIEAEAEAEAAQPVTAQALAIIDRDRKEVEDAYKDFSKKWRKGRSLGNVSSGGGYRAGREAGDRVDISNRSRGGLAAGQGSLKRGRRRAS